MHKYTKNLINNIGKNIFGCKNTMTSFELTLNDSYDQTEKTVSMFSATQF